MKNLKIVTGLIGLATLLGCAACESFVTDISEEKLPAAESKLVVNSVISPQLAYITVVVTESIP